MSWLVSLDKSFVVWINGAWSSSTGDHVFSFLSARPTWWAVTALAPGFALALRSRRHLTTLALAVFAIFLSDVVCARLLKPYFQRPRPCHQMMLHIPDGCGGTYSFPSNHAANAGAVAAVIAFRMPGPWAWLAFTLASLVGLSRIYLGVHFPTDVLSGFALGASVGAALIWLAQKYRRRKSRVPIYSSPNG